MTHPHYEQCFEIRFLRSKGAAFQDLFTDLMSKAHPGDFMACRPWGNIGNRKNDGYLKSQRILFQVYAPNEMRMSDAIDKIVEDFTQALPFWKDHFDTWVFVHNSITGLGPDINKKLLDLEQAHEPIHLQAWGFEELLQQFRLIPLATMCSMYGTPPRLAKANRRARTNSDVVSARRVMDVLERRQADVPTSKAAALVTPSKPARGRSVTMELVNICMNYYRDHFVPTFEEAVHITGKMPQQAANEVRNAMDHIAAATTLSLRHGSDRERDASDFSIDLDRAIGDVERGRWHLALARHISILHVVNWHSRRISARLSSLTKNTGARKLVKQLQKQLLELQGRVRSLPSTLLEPVSTTTAVSPDIRSIEKLTQQLAAIKKELEQLHFAVRALER